MGVLAAEAPDTTIRKEAIMLSALSRPAIGRSLTIPAVAALAGVCVVHLLDGPGSLSDQFYVGALELALAVACAPLAVMLLMRPTRSVWRIALVLNLAAMAVFVLSRTTGLPGSTEDIGNWSQLLGGVNLLTEATLIGLATFVMRPRRAR
jgi:hypothetical protein